MLVLVCAKSINYAYMYFIILLRYDICYASTCTASSNMIHAYMHTCIQNDINVYIKLTIMYVCDT